MNAVFVYGLLKPGQRLYSVAEPFVVSSTPARTRGRLYDAGSSEASPSDGLPAARFDEDGEIEGVVFFIDEPRLDEALRVLDDLEDEGIEYGRIVISTHGDEGVIDAWAYQYLLPVTASSYVGTSWT